ncbi:MAG: serine hydrolase, partial [Bacteroidota bacterium]
LVVINDTIADGQSVQLGSQTLTTSGSFTEVFTAANGCDSTVTINLTVLAANPVVTAALEKTLNSLQLDAGALSAAVLNSDGTISPVANGFASLGVAVAPNQQFGLSDVSQLVTAVAVLKAVEDGTINLTDNVTTSAGTATIDQLLQHLSGYGDFGTAAAYNDPGLGIIYSDLSQDFSGNLAPIFALAGSQGATGSFGYANTNFLALGGVTGVDAGQFTGIEFYPGAGPEASYLFNLSGIASEFLVDQTSVLTSAGAAGGLTATPIAVAEFMRALFADQTILNTASLASLQTFNTANPAGRLGNAYGRGIERFTLNIEGTDYEFVGHVGGLNYSTAFIYSDVLNTGAYVASNNESITDAEILEIARQLIRSSVNPAACPVNPVTTNIGATICDGESFAFGGNNLTAAGTYVDSLLGTDGCDSLIVLTLAVRPLPAVNDVSLDVCDNELSGVDLTVVEPQINTFVGGFEYVGIANPTNATVTANQIIPVVYTEGGSGCSDTADLTINVLPTFSVFASDTINLGDTLVFGSQILTGSGTFTETFTASTGCDSTVTLNLIVAGDVFLFIDPDTTDIGLNQTFTVDVFVETGIQTIDGFFLDLTFDTNFLQVNSVTEQATAEFPTTLIPPTINNALGTIRYSRGTFANFPQGTIKIATLEITAIAPTSGTDINFVGLTDVTFGGFSVLTNNRAGNVFIRDLSNVTVNYTLQGRSDFSGNENGNFFTVEFYNPGTSNLVASFTGVAGTAGGQLNVGPVITNDYDVFVKHTKYLARLVNASLVGGANTVNAGQLRAGDANNDNLVNLTDFSILASSFGKISTDIGYNENADFNADDAVVLIDFSLLNSNFNVAGAVPGGALSNRPAPLNIGSDEVELYWDFDTEFVNPGEFVTARLIAKAGQQNIDGVEAHLNFSTDLMEITNVEMGSALPVVLTNQYDNTNGTLDLAAGSLTTMPNGEVEVAVVTFKTKNVEGIADVTFQDRGARVQNVTAVGESVLTDLETETLYIGEKATSLDNDALNGIKLNVFPVPSDGNITVEIETLDLQEMELKIYNMTGQLIYSQAVKGSVKENLDLTRHAVGTYRIQLTTENGVIYQNFSIK